MNVFDDYSPAAWQDEGVLWVATAGAHARTRADRPRRSKVSTALVTLATAAAFAFIGTEVSPSDTGQSRAMLFAEALFGNDSADDLVPIDYWKQLGTKVAVGVPIEESDDTDLAFLI